MFAVAATRTDPACPICAGFDRMPVVIAEQARQDDGSLGYRYSSVETRRCFLCSPEGHRTVFAVTTLPDLPGQRVVVHISAADGTVTRIEVGARTGKKRERFT